MKRILTLLPVLSLLLLLTACGSEEDEIPCFMQGDCPGGYSCDMSRNICVKDSTADNGGDDNSDSGNNGGGDDNGDKDPAAPDADGTIPNEEEHGYYVNCTPGDTQPCYEGPSGTSGIGICTAGVRTCVEDGTDWSECVGQVLPRREICSNGIDEDCDGQDMTPENAIDLDGDGYTYCDGDCCETGWESDSPGCRGTDSPERMNPGAYEFTDNSVDDNCNGEIDEVEVCDQGLVLQEGDYDGNAEKLAKAMGICRGLVSAKISLAGTPATEQIDSNPQACNSSSSDGQSYQYQKTDRPSLEMPHYDSTAKTFEVPEVFGSAMHPNEGTRLAVLSTGQWNSPTQNAQCATIGAGDMQTASTVPEDWMNMMPNCEVPKAPSCGGTAMQDGLTNQCAGKALPVVQDPIMLTLNLKVPANANAFEFKLFFMSIEFPSTVCSPNNYNDFFVALLDSTYNEKNPNAEFRNPYDKNLAKDEFGNPVGVDLAPAGLFKACNPNCNSTNKWNSCTGDSVLAGSGFGSGGSGFIACQDAHGGTGWLTVTGNVVPDEEITLRLAIWEQGEVGYGPDHSWDSTVVLDGFRWLPRPGKAGVSDK